MTSINSLNISRAYVQNADATQGSAGVKPQHGQHQKAAQQPTQTDSVSFSDDAKSLAAAREAVQNTDDVRADKVAEIKQRVQDGTYSVSSRVLAQKMLASEQNQQ